MKLARVVLCLILLPQSLRADTTKVIFGPVPDWVREINWSAGANESLEPKSAGTLCLLYELQERPKKSEEFVRGINLMRNESGVQDSGSLRIEFDAEYQELCLHRVVIHRDGKTINRLDPAKVRVIQPEGELSADIFTGCKTAVLFIEDLRVGDALEYAYTLRGRNPVLDGHYACRFIVQSDSPLERELFRIVWDDTLPLHQRTHLTQAQPVVVQNQNGREYTWDFSRQPAIPYEDHRPAEYEPYPYLEVSDFADWSEVVNWALPLYHATPTNLPVELQEILAQWQNAAKTDEEKVRSVLEFVQDKIRYTGIELGPESYCPADPLQTFQKRYGDCKGKVVLCRFLLQQMGFEAYPALVNAFNHEAVEKHLPSPFEFNHVILQVQLDGKIVWLDPTCAHQGNLVWNRYLPPYGKALIIRPGNRELEDVPRSRPENAFQQKAVSIFDIASYKQPVRFRVRTEYRSASADEMRDEIASTPTHDLQKSYLNYYSRLYSGISTAAPLKITDNRTTDILWVEESYVITNLWERDGKDGLWKASFYADNLYNTLTDPHTRLRKSPLALAHPVTKQQQVVVNLPDEDWQIPESRTNIDNSAFSFRSHHQYRGKTLTLDYECRTKLATIPADVVAAYLTDVDRMNDLLTETLQRPDGRVAADGVNWLMVIIAIFGMSASVVGGIWFWRRSQLALPTVPPIINDSKLQGLGGWLVLVGFGLCLGPLMRVFTLGSSWSSYFSLVIWQNVAMPQGSSYHPLYAPLLMLEMLGNIFLLSLNVLALVMFFKQHRMFPGVFITLLLANAVFLISDDLGCALIPSLRNTVAAKDHTDAIRAVIGALVWCAYMAKSKRVKATFIR